MKLIWSCWGPEKCKFFAWLFVQDRLPTSDIMSKKGIDNGKWCPFYHIV